jgi:hemoglobin
MSQPINLFEAIGGLEKCQELSTIFYGTVAREPALRPLFPGKNHRCAIEQLTAFLVQFLGGPTADAHQRWWLSLRESHLRFQISRKERDAWLRNMTRALAAVEMAESTRVVLQDFFETSSAYLVNSGPKPAQRSCLHEPIASRWEEQKSLDDAIAAVRAADIDRVTALLEGSLLRSRFASNRSVYASFVAVLIGSGQAKMAELVQTILQENPDLAHESYSARSLLHAASAAGNLPFVTALLKLGVDPDIQDGGRHTPLYTVGNECSGGAEVIRALVQAGAKVDAAAGVKRCTALHMAARRGNVDAAAALLDCGANIEARDSQAETPLRRAVNLGKTNVAALLLSRRANPLSIGRKGETPLSVAKTPEMRTLLETWTRT